MHINERTPARGSRRTRATTATTDRADLGRILLHKRKPQRRLAALAVGALVLGLLGGTATTVLAPTSASAESNPATTSIRGNNIFNAYVEAGENLDALFTKTALSGTSDATVTVRGPGGFVQTCVVPAAAPVGSNCNLSNLASGIAGVWEIQINTPTGETSYFDWAINVQSGTANVPGRVWTEQYNMFNVDPVDLTFTYVSEQGFQYETIQSGFRGVDANIASDAVGNTLAGTCVPAYKSYDGGVPPVFPYGDDAVYDTPIIASGQSCGDSYKIFFESPASDLPETAVWPDGSTSWVIPPVVLPDVTSLQFDKNGNADRSGTFTVEVANFAGGMSVQIDINGDGDYTDPEDVALPVTITDGPATVAWDGLDGLGNPAPATGELSARAFIDRTGEIHFVNGDVEGRTSIQVTALNGPQAGTDVLYWDDSDLRVEDRLCSTPVLDGTAGASSTGGVHGWPCFLNNNSGISGSWGDVRFIDDWTYQTVAEELAIVLDPLPDLTVEKSSTFTENSRPGDTITYTVTATNTGEGDYTQEDPAVVFDDLVGVLDDATYNNNAVATASDGSIIPAPAFLPPSHISWAGPLASGASVTITYTVTLGNSGDRTVENVAWAPVEVPPPGEIPPTPECAVDDDRCAETLGELPKLAVDKSAGGVTELPQVGETVTYTVTATNIGPGIYTDAAPAVVVDDLSDVLDDATLDEDSLEASLGADAVFVNGQIRWTGALNVGQTLTITYDVTYTAVGDALLSNVAWQPNDPDEETPLPPACDPRTVAGLDPVTGEPCGLVNIPAGQFDVVKNVNPADGSTVLPGQEMTYTITFNSTGRIPANIGTWVDDLSGVLDDAEIVSAPTSANLTVSPIDGEGRFDVSGTIPQGQSYTVTYTVRVLADAERGDNTLGNFVFPDGGDPPVTCEDGDPLCTVNFVPEIVDAKSVDPATNTSVKSGQELTYTLTFTNNGTGAGPVARVDDLTHVLDDADVIGAPASSNAALTVSGIVNGRFSIAGELAAGQTVTVTYTVRVKAADQLGDTRLANFLMDPDEEPPVDPVCTDGDDCTFNPVSDVTVVKSSNPAKGTQVRDGQEIIYTLTFTNRGQGAEAISYTDHMSRVLDDADLTKVPATSDSALTASSVTNGSFTVSGELAGGQTVTATYTVKVRPWANQGDHRLGNVVTVTGQQPPTTCAADSQLCTEHPVQPPAQGLAVTGGEVAAWVLLTGLALLIGGGALVMIRRRRLDSIDAEPLS